MHLGPPTTASTIYPHSAYHPHLTLIPNLSPGLSTFDQDRLTSYPISAPFQSEAAANTQGVSRGRPLLLTKKPKKKKKGKYSGFAVFYGRVPGAYLTWAIVEPLIHGVHDALYKGYKSLTAAEAAFEYARSKSWVRVCTSRPPSPLARTPRDPQPAAIPLLPTPTGYCEPRNPLHGHNDGDRSPDSKWYIVYTGITPRVYQSFLECGLNTVGLSGSFYDSADSRDDAVAKYLLAYERGHIRVVGHRYLP
ncbi:hypothetical protein B0H13DRAFT_2362899 [Mycena leptocephala]|nr:hypothetical protein B0H13DRAFT_2362899 [Mycena leptocephala]